MKKLFIVAIAALALSMPVLSSAADYTYLETSYTNVDVREYSYDSVALKGSLELGSAAFVFGGYSNSDDSDFGVGLVEIGAGLQGAASENTDVFVSLATNIAVDSRQDFGKYTYQLESGFGYQLLDSLELRGGLLVDDLSRSAEFYATAGAEYSVTDSLRLGLDLFGRENVLGGTAAVRWYF